MVTVPVKARRNNRNPMLDIVSGFFIIEVVIQHLLQNTNLSEGTFWSDYFEHFFLAFMPWFYFKAGYMVKSSNEDLLTKIKIRGIKLLYPYFVWSIIPAILILPLFLIDHDVKHWINNIAYGMIYAQGAFNTPLWFLPSLFFVYGLYYVGLLKGTVLHLLVVGGVSFGVSQTPFLLPLGLNTIPLGCFYFSLGMLLRNKNIRIGKGLWLTLLVFYTTIILVHFSAVNFHKNSLTDGNYFLYLAEMILFLFLVQQLLCKEIHFTPLEYIGKKSMIFYVTHAPVIVLVKKINDIMGGIMSNSAMLTVMTIGILLLWVLLIWKEKHSKFLFTMPLWNN